MADDSNSSNSTNSTPTKEEQEQLITNALSQPQSYSVDGESITFKSMSDIEKGLQLLAKRKISPRNAFRALGVAHISTPGTNER